MANGEKLLMVLRHADARGRLPIESDEERPLSNEGKRAAEAMGALLERRRLMPDGVLCSTALRTRQTWELLRDKAEQEVKIELDKSLYSGGADRYLTRIQAFKHPCDRLLLIGHNPTVTSLARGLLADLPGSAAHTRLGPGFQPCNLAVFSLAIESWDQVRPASASLLYFFTLTDLALPG